MDKNIFKANIAAFRAWESRFTAESRADKLRHFRDHIEFLKQYDEFIKCRPSWALEATVHSVETSVVYRSIDGIRCANFLNLQCYDPAEAMAKGARYVFTLAYLDRVGRLFVSKKADVDLVDLFSMPWDKYKIAGFTRLYISRIDRKRLTSKEASKLYDDVMCDFLYDYGEDEIQVNWYPSEDGRVITVLPIETIDCDNDYE